MEAGVQTPRRDAGAGLRLLPRLGVAAGADRAASRSRRRASCRATSFSSRPTSIRWMARSGTDKDFCDLHAWTEIYIPGAGWIGFDVTSGLLCGEGHIPLAATPHYRSAAPITGTVDAGERRRSRFDMSIERIHEAPRITEPFSDEAWQKLDALGDAVDRGSGGERCAPDHGRRADLRVDRRSSRRGMEYGGASGRPSAQLADDLIRRCASALRPTACCITDRASGIRAKACRAGPSRSIGARTASRSGAIRDAGRARKPGRATRIDRRAETLPSISPSRLGTRHRLCCCRPMKIRPHWMLKEGELPHERRSSAIRRSTIRKRARAWCACSNAG